MPGPSKIAGLWPEVTAAGGVGYYHEQEKLDEVDSPVALDITSHSNDPDLPTFTPKVAFPAALAINSPSTDPEMPTFTPRTLLQFETIFLTDSQVKKFEEMFCKAVKTSNPIYLAWKALKSACLPTEAEAVDAVLKAHTPENILKRKARGGRKVPGAPSRFDPTSPEWRTCMEEATAAKKAKATPKKKTVENKKTAPKKTLLKKTPPKKTTPKKTPPKKTPPKESVKPTKNASKKTASAKKPEK